MRRTKPQRTAYNAGYDHGWYAPTYPCTDSNRRYNRSADYRLHYNAGFADGKVRNPRQEAK